MNIDDLRDTTLIERTLRLQDLIPAALGFLNDIDAPEYVGYLVSNIPPSYAMEDAEADWWSDEAPFIWDDLLELLTFYGPEGTTFGTHPGDGADWGWWTDDQEAQA
jgi:hypothetical protein